MNPDTNFPEPILPPAASSKRQWMLSLTAIGMGLVAAAFLLTRPRIHASVPKAGCDACGASEPASNTCEMRAAPSNPTDANTQLKKSGVPHE